MSWEINKDSGLIKITKNDTPTFNLNLTAYNQETGEYIKYVPSSDDSIIFAISEDKYTNTPLVTIPLDKSTMSLTFPEGWANGLELGKYWYEISLNNGDYHETFIEGKRLIITMEIYRGE